MAVTLVKTLFTQTPKENVKNVTVSGWVRTMRESKAFGFVELNDGSCFTQSAGRIWRMRSWTITGKSSSVQSVGAAIGS